MLIEDRKQYRNAGGCTAVVTLFILGKMYVANAGDSRAILAQKVIHIINDIIRLLTLLTLAVP